MYSLLYIGNDISKVLNKKPDNRHVVELLAQNANKYKRLALVLDVDYEFVEGLKSGDDDIVNLDKVIRRWMRTCCSPVTWNTIIEAVESVVFGKNLDLGEKIRNWLRDDKPFSYYMEQS